jgi:shikimate kinase
MLILLIGPSGVGKSTLGEYASKVLNCEFYDIDKRVKTNHKVDFSDNRWQEKYFDITCQEIRKIELENNDDCLVDLGAGSIESQRAKVWLEDKITISITASPEEVIIRNPCGPNRDINEYILTEYSPYRLLLYKSAKFNFPVNGLKKDQAKQKFVEFLYENILKR